MKSKENSAAQVSITEIPSTITENIDTEDAAGIMEMLRQTDAQIFQGYQSYPGLRSQEFIGSLVKAHDILTSHILHAKRKNKRFRVVLSGAGTSGRLAMLLATSFNEGFGPLFGYPVFDFLIAGGYHALIKAQEGAEDDPVKGIEDLEKTVKKDPFLFIGITCGLSAHYIAGQIHHTVLERKQPAFLIGFNPLEGARTLKPEGWDKSFMDVARKMRNDPLMTFLNPVIGPEPITGSTRMKGGTATKIIGEMLLYSTILSVHRVLNTGWEGIFGTSHSGDTEILYRTMIDEYERTVRTLYDRSESLLPALAFAGDSLNQGGHIYYLGEGTAGKLGIVDASECPPTFGAGYNDVRGFIENGWRSFCPLCTGLSDSGPLFNIDLNYFERNLLPELTENDTLILTGTEGFFGRYSYLPDLCKRANVYKILIGGTYPAHPKHSSFDLIIGQANDREKMPFFTSTSLKLIYNAITTAAYIFKGKVFKNKMIDLRISNTKLYQRSIRIIGELMGVEEEIAKEALLRSVYQTDHLKTAVLNDPLSRHVAMAAKREKIVPVALVLATGEFTYREAFARVEKEHIIRNIIKQSGKFQEVR